MSSAERLEAIRGRIQNHRAREQQLEGRRQSLTEQRARYVDELAKAGLTPEQLPAHIDQLDQQLSTRVAELEQTLAAAGA